MRGVAAARWLCHRPFYVGSRARGHSGGTLVGGRMTSAPSFHSLRTRCAAYGDDRRDTSLSGRLTCVQALAKLCRFASEPRAHPNVWPEPRSGGSRGSRSAGRARQVCAVVPSPTTDRRPKALRRVRPTKDKRAAGTKLLNFRIKARMNIRANQIDKTLCRF